MSQTEPGVSSHVTCHDGHISAEQSQDPGLASQGVKIQLLQLTCTYSQFPPPLRQQSEMLKFIINLMVDMKAFRRETQPS